MAKTLTLEEAAQKLGLTPEQFKINLKTHKDFKAVRPLMGGATMHFRAQDIDELARRLGLGSEPELQLGDAGSDPVIPLSSGEDDDDQIEIGRDVVRGSGHSSQRLKSPSSKRLPKSPEEAPLSLDDSSEEFIPLTEDRPSGKPDSAVRLSKGSGRTPTGEPQQPKSSKVNKAGEVFELAKDPPSKTAGKPPSSKVNKPPSSRTRKGDNKEFELKLGADSSDEFELTLADDGSDEVDLGAVPRDATGKQGKSGVNLRNPADSGISLEKKKQPESDSEFELNLDSSKTGKVSGPKSSIRKRAKPDSDSEFELTLDDSSSEVPAVASGKEGDKDIFETDFDIPALDDESASEAVVLEETDTDLESSDFDLALDESGMVADDSASEVVELDEAAEARPSARRRAAGDDDEVSAAEELAGVDEDEEPVTVAAPPGAKAKWGPLPALVLAPCLLVMFFVSIMGFEMLRSMWGYHQPANKGTSTVTRGVASLFMNENELPKE